MHLPLVKRGRGRPYKIEEVTGKNLGLQGMRLLSEHVNDPNVPRREKLEVLQPYLTKLMPVLVEVTDTASNSEIKALAEAIKAIQEE